MSKLTVSEAFCYICRSVLIEPVTTPCKHVFCLSCFEQSMLETSYCCPLCRRRLSNWERGCRKNKNLVDEELWNRIQVEFKKQVELKRRGEDDGLDAHAYQTDTDLNERGRIVSQPGELAEEFLKLKENIESMRRKEIEEEEKASAELINALKEADRVEMESQLLESSYLIKQDEAFARNLQEQFDREDLDELFTRRNEETAARNNENSLEENTNEEPINNSHSPLVSILAPADNLTSTRNEPQGEDTTSRLFISTTRRPRVEVSRVASPMENDLVIEESQSNIAHSSKKRRIFSKDSCGNAEASERYEAGTSACSSQNNSHLVAAGKFFGHSAAESHPSTGFQHETSSAVNPENHILDNEPEPLPGPSGVQRQQSFETIFIDSSDDDSSFLMDDTEENSWDHILNPAVYELAKENLCVNRRVIKNLKITDWDAEEFKQKFLEQQEMIVEEAKAEQNEIFSAICRNKKYKPTKRKIRPLTRSQTKNPKK